MYRALFVVGWLLSRTPLPLVKALNAGLASLFYRIPSKRRWILYSNLHHAFPEKDKTWFRHTVRRICQQTVEMGLFTIACPHFSLERFKSCVRLTADTEKRYEELFAEGRPVVGFGFHHTMIEAFNASPAVTRFKFPETLVMFRPHKNPKIDDMIRRHRERCGFQLVSRKDGLRKMGEVLRKNGMGIVLFDQNTRDHGSLIPFFGRVTSATELPGLLAQKYRAIPIVFTFQKLDYWKTEVSFERLEGPCEAEALTLASNAFLEREIERDPSLLVNWLWSHNRWKILFRPFERLGMNHRKKIVDFKNYPVRKTRFALLHSDLHTHESAVLEFLKALRASRPDAEISVVTRRAEAFQSDHADWVDRAWELPCEKKGRKHLAKRLQDEYLDLLIVMEDSEDLHAFAKATQIPQRFGVLLRNRKTRAITDFWIPENPEEWDQYPDWISFGQEFGLETSDYS